MPGTLILGYGNPLRADDGLGRRVAEQLGGMSVHQLAPELAETISQADIVIFVDAVETGTPGEWNCTEVVPGESGGRLFTHQVDPSTLLEAARVLYGHAPRGWLFTVAGECFDLREGLSASVTNALPAVIKAIRSKIV
jgi:hydrogenase maturation protease